MHLMIDGIAQNKVLMESQVALYDWLVAVVGFIGMRCIDDPCVVKFNNCGCGLSGYVLLAESHVSVHTFPESHWVYIDIFSCKDFDSARTEDMICLSFKMVKAKKYIAERGKEWNQ